MSSTTGTAAQDVVGVFDSNLNQLFVEARPMTCRVDESTKMMTHPKENGALQSDHRIVNLIEIELTMILNSADYADVYAQIKTLKTTNSSVTVLTKVDSYENMFLEDMPHQETGANPDSIQISLKLTEAQIASTTVTTVTKNPADMPTTRTGAQSGTTATSTPSTEGNNNKGSLAYSWVFGSKN